MQQSRTSLSGIFCPFMAEWSWWAVPHAGAAKTFTAATQIYKWPGMSKKILDMVDALQGMSAEARVLASNTTHEAISDGWNGGGSVRNGKRAFLNYHASPIDWVVFRLYMRCQIDKRIQLLADWRTIFPSLADLGKSVLTEDPVSGRNLRHIAPSEGSFYHSHRP